jgi:TetR/AcrR family transcriptional regulator, transcriptional repressor of bet genes
MRSLKKKSRPRPPIPRARNSHSRQRQKLIDACISALHIYGPSRTTVEKVVAIANMSPGIVRFYFASKASMLVASLQFLAAEFEEQLLVPVGRLKGSPVAALQLMVDLYLDAEIASPRKVSVWYAFWGEASSRQEYYDICGKIDERFAALVHELIGRLIIDTGQPHLDPNGIALGLMGALEMLWQDFAFRTEGDIDRPAAKHRCMAYLRSVFPGQFPASPQSGAAHANVGLHVADWAYENNRLLALERQLLFQDSWQFVGHSAQVPNGGDFLAPDLGFERPLILRGEAGELRAFRNSCTEAPHILVPGLNGHLNAIKCPLHGLEFNLDGTRRGGRAGNDLTALDLCLIGDLILVRSRQRAAPAPRDDDAWLDLALPAGSRPLKDPAEVCVSADWKLVVEHCLELSAAAGRESDAGWSRRSYDRLLGSAAEYKLRLRLVAPNHLIDLRPDGYSILQVLPIAPGRSLMRWHHYTHCPDLRPALAAQFLASRLRPQLGGSMIVVAESTQKGLAIFGQSAAQTAPRAAEVTAFRQYLLAKLPALGLDQPPHDMSAPT